MKEYTISHDEDGARDKLDRSFAQLREKAISTPYLYSYVKNDDGTSILTLTFEATQPAIQEPEDE